MSIGPIAEAFVRVRPDTTGFRAEAETGIRASVASLGAGGIISSSIRGAAAITGVGSAAVGTATALREIVVGGGEYEREMDTIATVTGAAATEMEDLRTLAKELGADIRLPGISAADAAVSMNELAKAGLDVEDVMGGVAGALQLAVASGGGIASTASTIGSALNVFSLEGTRAADVADLLAGASIAAQGDIGDMQLALQQSGAVARQAGLSIEQTVGAIALLAKNGLLGSDAGTSLRTTLLRLIPTTNEARQFVRALGIEIDNQIPLGEQFSSVIDQYAEALAKLPPGLQQQALTQIFGTDAIRAASIFAREGAEGYELVTAQANRAGAAMDLTSARTDNVIGAFQNLGSQLETSALKVGERLNPALEDLVNRAADTVIALGDIAGAVEDLNSVEIPSWIPGFGNADGGSNDDDDLGRLQRPFDFLTDQLNNLVGYEPEIASLRDTMSDLRSPDVIDRAQVVQEARGVGQEVGVTFTSAVAQGIQETAVSAQAAARATLTNVIAQGKIAIQSAVASAQNALSGLGSSLAADAAAVIDSGPITQRIEQLTAGAAAASRALGIRRQREAIQDAEERLGEALRDAPIQREIERLQRALDAEARRDDRTDIGRDLRDAQESLAEARRAAATEDPLTTQQQGQRRRFLRPFVEEVQDAQREVRRFNTETKIDTLQARLERGTDDITENISRLRESLQDAREALVESQSSFATEGLVNSLREAQEAQKRTVQQGIDDTIQEFNDGLITLPQLNRRLANLLAENGVDYENAGATLGTAFVRGFEAKLQAIGIQASAILAGPQIPGAGIVGQPIRPAQAVADARTAEANAAAALERAIREEGGDTQDVLREIERHLRPRGTTTPTVARRGGR